MKPGSKVHEADLSECLAYLEFCTTHAREHPGTQREVIEWLLDRNRKTLIKARTLYLDKWPWGEALREVREKQLLVLWQCTASGSDTPPDRHAGSRWQGSEKASDHPAEEEQVRGQRLLQKV